MLLPPGALGAWARGTHTCETTGEVSPRLSLSIIAKVSPLSLALVLRIRFARHRLKA
ncbi:hypothetical protein HMPREF0580_0613 [Mobiluncus mulieris ATCC 35239]|uniref:Uncharacterized protein n=1 Tax=Mobiluncus mulieris ATCC 35239 TaxID=871571 RepID=E0QNZ9_9ACTO|nr:hypothetical protein HMPREF0580_0613 [Mobiluncus mulieris ATCC 35239]